MIAMQGLQQRLPSSLWPMVELAWTLLAFEVGRRIQGRLGRAALANPVGIAVVLVSGLLWMTGRPTAEYATSVQVLPMLLGLATVSLAVPLHRNLPRIRQSFGPVLVGVVTGVATATLSAIGTAITLGASKPLLLAVSTKTATAAIAIAVAGEIGSDPNLAAGISILTGIVGAVLCTGILDLVGVRDARARGLATGVAAHGIGTARMLALDAEAGGFAGLGMGLSGILVGVLVPIFIHRWIGLWPR